MTEREASWGGPRQYLSLTNISEYQLEFQVKTTATIALKCKLHVKRGSESGYLTLFSAEVKRNKEFSRFF